MARSSEEVLLIVEHVKNKKCEGFLYMMSQRMAWMPQTKKSFTVSHNYADIKSQKISPDSKEKIQLQVVFHDGGANTFHFVSPDGREKRKTDRDSIKELLSQLLPKFRSQINSELEEKNRILQEDPQMFQLYKDLVVTSVITADEFWANHAHKKFRRDFQQVGVSAAFLTDVKPQADGCNGLKYNLTAEVIEAIFRTYPIVKQKHLENVPHKMVEQEFWTKFFQSHYVYRDQIAQNSKELFSDCAKADDESLSADVLQTFHDPLLSIVNMSDNTSGDGYGQVASAAQLPEASKSAHNINSSIIKRFNQHSSRVLQVCHEKSAAVASTSAKADEDSQDQVDARNAAVSSGQAGPSSKKRKINDKIDYSDLRNEDGGRKGAKLSLTKLDCYLQGPTAETRTVYRTNDDILNACQEVAQDVMVWQPSLVHSIIPSTAISALGELTPGGALMKGNRKWATSDGTVEHHRQELQQLYVALCELLRHFWQCFPVTSKTLEEKVVQMRSTLERFQNARLAPFKHKLVESHTPAEYVAHLEHMLDKAYEKFNIWHARQASKR